MAVLPSADKATELPWKEEPELFVPTNLPPCWLQVLPLLVYTQAAPRPPLSDGPPTIAVLPSADRETEIPCCAPPTLPVPTSFEPCCTLGKGVGVTVKLVALVAEPPAVLTETAPVTAPGITRPTKTVPVLEITIAVLPPIVKKLGLFKPVPLIVTKVPTGPLEGVKVVIVGCAQAKLWHKTQKRSRNFLFISCFFTIQVVFKKMCRLREFTPLNFLLKETIKWVLLVPLASRIIFFLFKIMEKFLFKRKLVDWEVILLPFHSHTTQ
jgi:hypothetical protein